MPIFVQREKAQRKEVLSLESFLREPLTHGCVMDSARMTDEDRAACHWIGFGIGKGVTNPSTDTSVFSGVPAVSELHGELIQGFAGVDPTPQCYQIDHALGFGDFVRWVYFSHPKEHQGILGIDFFLKARPTAGIANTAIRVCAIARTCMAHGIPGDDELVLLNPRMVEENYLSHLRQCIGLRSVHDWSQKGPVLFGLGGLHCPRCGQATMSPGASYCSRCGCDHRVFEEDLKMAFGSVGYGRGDQDNFPAQPKKSCTTHDSMPGDRFCRRCGEALPVTCSCDKQFRSGDNFCGNCGKPKPQ